MRALHERQHKLSFYHRYKCQLPFYKNKVEFRVITIRVDTDIKNCIYCNVISLP